MVIKICTRCNREKLIYAKGLCSSCYVVEYLKSHPEYKERQKLSGKKWKEAHPGYSKEYYQKNREKLIKNQIEYNRKRNEGVIPNQ